MKNRILSIALLFLLFTSCMVTKTPVGEFIDQKGTEVNFDKRKQFYLIGIFPLGRTETRTPNDGNCMVVTKYNLGDVLIGALTLGIIRSYTIKVVVKESPAIK